VRCGLCFGVLFFGMGMPTPGAYLLAVLLSAPALIKFGFPELSVHMFVFYFAIISALTPPVAVGVLVAVGISGGSYVGTAENTPYTAGLLLPLFHQPEILAWQRIRYRPYTIFILMGTVGLTLSDGFLLYHGWLRPLPVEAWVSFILASCCHGSEQESCWLMASSIFSLTQSFQKRELPQHLLYLKEAFLETIHL
jgi:TRAP-type uncharacterized transport system fused permease subunit